MRISDWSSDVCSSDLGRALTEDAPKQQAERGDTACIIYTSGTSGRPKGVMLSHGAIICNCLGAYQFLKDLPDLEKHPEENGRASCRERVWRYVEIMVVAVSF